MRKQGHRPEEPPSHPHAHVSRGSHIEKPQLRFLGLLLIKTSNRDIHLQLVSLRGQAI